MLENLFGEIALDINLKAILRKFSQFSFFPDSSLRTSIINTPAVTVSSGTITTVSSLTAGTVSTSVGDSSKGGTLQMVSAQSFYSSVGKNFTRS